MQEEHDADHASAGAEDTSTRAVDTGGSGDGAGGVEQGGALGAPAEQDGLPEMHAEEELEGQLDGAEPDYEEMDFDEDSFTDTEGPHNLSVSDQPAAALLLLEVECARDLPRMDLMTGAADPFCVVRFGTRAFRSRVIKRTRNPNWGQRYTLLLSPTELKYDVQIQVWDWDKISKNDYIGCVYFCVADLKPGSIEPYILQIMRPQPKLKNPLRLIRKMAHVLDGGKLHVRAGLVTKEQAEAVFWEAFCQLVREQGEGLVQEHWQAMVREVQDGKVPPVDQLWPGQPDLVWRAYLEVQAGNSIADLLGNESHGEISTRGEEDKQLRKEVVLQNRATGKLEVEQIKPNIKVAMRLLYGNRSGRWLSSKVRWKSWVLQRLTVRQGQQFDEPQSARYIQGFIDFYGIDMDEVLEDLERFDTFNKFFYRKLKPGARPIAEPDKGCVAVSPADCRLVAYDSVIRTTKLWVKGEAFTVESLLQDADLAGRFSANCSVVIARLAPQDYHRFHSPTSGRLGKYVHVDGGYHTVSPLAVNRPIDVFCSNRRVYTTINSPDFGLIAFVAVGAVMVGSISMTAEAESYVQKGDELGFFAFGGSTVILLFEPGSIAFDRDIAENSAKPLETLVQMGNRMGVATEIS